jgi:polysaccharide pyruvyl transferase WcaK-like protein
MRVRDASGFKPKFCSALQSLLVLLSRAMSQHCVSKSLPLDSFANIIFLNDTSITGHPGCVRVMDQLKKGLSQHGIKILASCPVGIDYWRWPAIRRALPQAHAVVINGEGTLHHTATRPKARKLAAAVQQIEQNYRIPVVIVNATVESLETEDFESLKSCKAIFVRESRSEKYLKLNQVPCTLAADLTLANSDLPITLKPKGLLVTDSVIPIVAKSLQQYASEIKADFLKMRPSKIYAYPRYFLKPQILLDDANEFLNKIAAAEYVVTGRFHTVLFCIAMGTPFLAVASNTGKIAAVLMDVFGTTKRLAATFDDFTNENIVEPWSETELLQLQHYRAATQCRLEDMFKKVSEIASSRLGEEPN